METKVCKFDLVIPEESWKWIMNLLDKPIYDDELPSEKLARLKCLYALQDSYNDDIPF